MDSKQTADLRAALNAAHLSLYGTPMPRVGQACALCDAAHENREAAETCEREHAEAHDAWCPCENCQHERAADTAKEMR